MSDLKYLEYRFKSYHNKTYRHKTYQLKTYHIQNISSQNVSDDTTYQLQNISIKIHQKSKHTKKNKKGKFPNFMTKYPRNLKKISQFSSNQTVIEHGGHLCFLSEGNKGVKG